MHHPLAHTLHGQKEPERPVKRTTTGVISSLAVLSEEGERRRQVKDAARAELHQNILNAAEHVRVPPCSPFARPPQTPLPLPLQVCGEEQLRRSLLVCDGLQRQLRSFLPVKHTRLS